MKRKLIAVTSITVLICVVLGNIVACTTTPTTEYTLIINSTEDGSVTTPGEDTYTYDEGEVVDLVATPDAGYQFVNWTGDVGTIADVNAATTTITMNDDYSITANFVEVAVYSLTIDKTPGGEVTTPGEGPFTYDAGTVVNLVAGAADFGGYRFIDWTGDVGTIANVYAAETTITMNGNYHIIAHFSKYMVSAAVAHTVGLKGSGVVFATGLNDDGQCDVGDWYLCNQVSAGGYHTVALFDVGGVDATGLNDDGQCDVGGWTDIIQVSAAGWHSVGLEDDGTVVAVGRNNYGQRDVGSWTDITQVDAGWGHTVGLEDDGTVVATGYDSSNQCDVDAWTDIIQVSAGGHHTVGLQIDGTVVATGNNDYGQCDVGDWTNITRVDAGWFHTVGLKNDGTVIATGLNNRGQCDVDAWMDIVWVSAGAGHTVGLKADGTVVSVGDNDYGQRNVDDWELGGMMIITSRLHP